MRCGRSGWVLGPWTTTAGRGEGRAGGRASWGGQGWRGRRGHYYMARRALKPECHDPCRRWVTRRERPRSCRHRRGWRLERARAAKGRVRWARAAYRSHGARSQQPWRGGHRTHSPPAMNYCCPPRRPSGVHIHGSRAAAVMRPFFCMAVSWERVDSRRGSRARPAPAAFYLHTCVLVLSSATLVLLGSSRWGSRGGGSGRGAGRGVGRGAAAAAQVPNHARIPERRVSSA